MGNFLNTRWQTFVFSAAVPVMGITLTGCADFGFGGLFSKQASPGAVSFGILTQTKAAANHQGPAQKDLSATSAWTSISAIPQAYFDNGQVAFGTSSAPFNLTLRNPGQIIATNFQISIEPPEAASHFSLTTQDCVQLEIENRSTCSIQAIFHPTTVAPHVVGNLVVTYNTGKGLSKSSIPMDGHAVAAPAYFFQPASLVFPVTLVGGSATLHTKLIYNGNLPGADQFKINPGVLQNDFDSELSPQQDFDGQSSPYTITATDCNLDGPDSGPIQAGTCDVAITYAPKAPSLNDPASLPFFYSALPYFAERTTTLAISGTATTITPMKLVATAVGDFGSTVRNPKPEAAPKPVTVTFSDTTGNQPGWVTGAAIQGPGGPDPHLSITGGTCVSQNGQPVQLPSHGSCTVIVSFATADMAVMDIGTATPQGKAQSIVLTYGSNISGPSNELKNVSGLTAVGALQGKSTPPATISFSNLDVNGNLALGSTNAFLPLSGAIKGTISGGSLWKFAYAGAATPPAVTADVPIFSNAETSWQSLPLAGDFNLDVTYTPQSANGPNGSKSSFELDYDDGAADHAGAKVVVTASGIGTQPLKFTTGLSPATFGSLLYGSTASTQTFSINFYGTETVSEFAPPPSTVSLTGSASDGALNYVGSVFPGGGTCAGTSTFGGGQSCTVKYQVTPPSTGTDGATLSANGSVAVNFFGSVSGLQTAQVYAASTPYVTYWKTPLLTMKYPTFTPPSASSTSSTTYDPATPPGSWPTIHFGATLENDSYTQAISLSGSGLVKNAANTINPFGVVINTVVLKSNGTATSGPYSVSSECTGFTSVALTSSWSSCSFNIAFSAPATSSTYTDVVYVNYTDAAGAAHQAQLNVTGTGDAKSYLTASPSQASALDFGSQIDSVQSSAKTVTVSYGFGGPGSVSATVASGSGPGTFSVSPATCTPKASVACAFNVVYLGSMASNVAQNPSSATLNLKYSGPADGTNSNSRTSTNFSYALKAQLTAPTFSLSSSADTTGTAATSLTPSVVYTKGSVGSLAVTFTNSGTGPLSSLVLGAVTGPYTAASPTDGSAACSGATLQPGQSCEVVITLNQSTIDATIASATAYAGNIGLSGSDKYGKAGAASVTAYFTSTISPPSANISMKSITPASGNFGSAFKDGTAAPLTGSIVFTNSGNADANTLTFTPPTGGGPFTWDTSKCTSIPAGKTCTVGVSASLANSTAGTVSQSLSLVYDNNPAKNAAATAKVSISIVSKTAGVTLTVAPNPFGKTLVGTTNSKFNQTITFKNGGQLDETNLQFSGFTGPFDYDAGSTPGSSGHCGSTLAAGQSCSLTLVYHPLQGAGVSKANAPVLSSGSLTWSTSTQAKAAIALSGQPVTPIQVFAGGSVTCLIDEYQQARCWGSNSTGQSGIGTASGTPTLPSGGEVVFPAAAGITSTDKLAVGDKHVCALVNGPVTNNVYCWGDNSFGQIGQDQDSKNPANYPLPQVIALGAKAIDITAGTGWTCAVLADGSVKCWGLNTAGALGIDADPASCPSVGKYGSTCTIGGSAVTMAKLPAVNLGASAIRVIAGLTHTCAILQGNVLKCWGDNTYGELGLGSTPSAQYQVISSVGGANDGSYNFAMSTLKGIDLGGVAPDDVGLGRALDYNCVLSSGAVRCFGSTTSSPPPAKTSAFGILGIFIGNSPFYTGATSLQYIPGVNCTGSCLLSYGEFSTQLGSNLAAIQLNGAKATQLAVGGTHTCILGSTGGVRCWGANGTGQIGNGTTTAFGNSLADFTGMTDVLTGAGMTDAAQGGILVGHQVAAGNYHTCAVTSANKVACWGSGASGAIGSGSTSNVTTATTAATSAAYDGMSTNQ